MRAKQQLSGAEENKRSLANEVEELNAEIARMRNISPGVRGMTVMAKEVEDLVKERTGLKEKVKGLSNKLQEVEDTRVAAVRNAEKLTLENARLEKELATAKTTIENLRSSSMTTKDNLTFLNAEKVRLEYELTKANTTLNSIKSSLGPFFVTPPTGTRATGPSESLNGNISAALYKNASSNVANLVVATDTDYTSLGPSLHGRLDEPIGTNGTEAGPRPTGAPTSSSRTLEASGEEEL